MAGANPVVHDENEEMVAGTAHVPEHVVFRAFAAETVVLNLQTGKYHGLNPTGGRMLEVLEKVPALHEAAVQLAGEWEQPVDVIERDLYEFCVGLRERGLIELNGVGPS